MLLQKCEEGMPTHAPFCLTEAVANLGFARPALSLDAKNILADFLKILVSNLRFDQPNLLWVVESVVLFKKKKGFRN